MLSMTKLDNIVCWGTGILSGVITATVIDLARQSSQNNIDLLYDTVSRFAIDLMGGGIALLVTTYVAYNIRDKLFYTKREWNEDLEADRAGPRGRYICEYIDKRTGEVVGGCIRESDKTDNR